MMKLACSNLKIENQEFFFENDTLRLSYDFFNENGPVYFEIYNKLDVPLYINWSKCAFISEENKIGYWEDKIIVNTSTSTTTYERNTLLSLFFPNEYSNTSGTLIKDEKIGFIPPRTKLIKCKFFVVQDARLKNVTVGEKHPFEVQQTWMYMEHAKRKKASFMKYTFTEENSPLKFRNYLTLSTSEDFKTEFHIDNAFWASEIQEVDARYFSNNPNLYLRYDLASAIQTLKKQTPQQREISKNFPSFSKNIFFRRRS